MDSQITTHITGLWLLSLGSGLPSESSQISLLSLPRFSSLQHSLQVCLCQEEDLQGQLWQHYTHVAMVTLVLDTVG